MNQTVVSPLGMTQKSVVSPFSSFGKEENGDTIDFLVSPIQDTIDYHLIQNNTKRNKLL